MHVPLWRTPGMPALLGVTIAGFSGYAVLLPLVPLWVVEGGAGPGGAGLVNGVLLAATVASQLTVPALLRRFGWGPVMAAGLILLGLPSFAHLLSTSLPLALGLAVVRGMGFAILTVTGAAAAAHLVGPERRGSAIGLYGLAVALPNLGLLPFGPILAEQLGWGVVFAIGTVPVLGIPFALAAGPHLPATSVDVPTSGDDSSNGDGSSQLRPSLRPLLVPAGLLLAVTLTGGAVITFAPQVVAHPSTATAALFAMGLSAALCRWWVGGLADRYGAARFVWTTTLLTTLCLFGLAFVLGLPDGTLVTGAPRVVVWVALSTLLGVGYGALQNLTYILTLRAAGDKHISAASAVWNAGFDGGTGIGSVAVGFIAAGAGFGWAFLAAGLACAASLPLAVRARRI